jgi:hypothetical protein
MDCIEVAKRRIMKIALKHSLDSRKVPDSRNWWSWRCDILRRRGFDLSRHITVTPRADGIVFWYEQEIDTENMTPLQESAVLALALRGEL